MYQERFSPQHEPTSLKVTGSEDSKFPGRKNGD